MDLKELMVMCDTKMIIGTDVNQSFYVHFECCEEKKGDILRSVSGRGKSIRAAIDNYINEIKGKDVVFNAGATYRREFTIPESLSFNNE